MQHLLFILIAVLISLPTLAQEPVDTSAQLEQLLREEEPQAPSQEDEKPEKAADVQVMTVDPKRLSDLGRLAPFNDIAVIQRRYLPKTNRFEFYPSVGNVINDVFFLNPILSGRLAYSFSEKYAVEGVAFTSSKSERQSVKDLKKRGVITEGFVFPQSYYGLDFKWTPIYGKMGFFNKSIVPFDQYFLLGGGVTNTNQKTSPGTFHLGTGQTYALSKWIAARWDVSFYWFSSKSNVGAGGQGNYMNIHLTLGLSFFFPGAQYR